MSNNYDNWERIVKVVLRREHDRQLALADSSESSFTYTSSSSFSSEASRNHSPQPQANTVNFLRDRMAIGFLEIKAKRGKQMEAGGQRIGPASLGDIINRLLESRRTRIVQQVNLLESEIYYLCNASREIFLSQPNLLELEAPMKICGNIHGQFEDLLRFFEFGGYPPKTNYLFLGGYVDYGKQSIETMCLLLAFKIKYHENFFLLRGNHECASLNMIYGFYGECKRRFNVRLWKVFIDCFNCLPVAAIVGDKIFCVHSGLSPDLDDFDQIRNLPRPTDVPESGLLCDLLWSDPSTDVKGWGINDRGFSYTFGTDKVTEFLMKHHLDLICRAHQVVQDGFEFFANKKLVTLFSAPAFRDEFDNTGACLSVDEALVCSFEIIKPTSGQSVILCLVVEVS